jgi:ribosomal protein S18 acetylase RimI-like enzyme
MTFRNATIKDAKELDKLLTLLIKDEKKYDNNVKPFKVKNYYKNYINDSNRYFYLCEDNNKIVGYIYTISIGGALKIDALYIKEDYQNKGIGTNLINNVIEYAKKNNIKFITINVLENNIKAKKLYNKYFKLNAKNGIKEELIMYL